MMLDGVCWERETPEHLTNEIESGLSLTTPCARDWKGHTITERYPNGFSQSLCNDVKKWPTPTCQDADKATKKWREKHQNNLTAAVFNPEKFPTPTVNDSHNCTMPPSQMTRDNLPGDLLRKGEKPNGGHLNPTWVEWLMGWPLGWTDLKPSATGKCHRSQR